MTRLSHASSSHRLTLVGTALLALAAGCSTDFSVPQEAQLGCKNEGDCPSGWACNANIGRCVKTENIDSSSPALVGEATVAPPVLKKGATAVVTFTASEELSEPPVVTVKVAGADRPLVRDEKASSGTKHVYGYTAAGDETQDVESAISIVLTDKSGNKSGNLSGKSIRFDFVLPELTDEVIVGSPAMKAGAVTATFTASEKLKGDPVVALATGEALAKDPSSKGLKFVYAYAATGAESQDAAGIAVTTTLEDEAGNAAVVTLAKTVVFDFVAPKITGEVVADPAAAAAGGLVTVTFSVDEPVKTPVVTLGGAPMDLSGAPAPLDTAFKFTHLAKEADGEGAKAAAITLEDAAGNRSEGLAGGTVAFDFTPPAITAGAVTPKVAKAGATVTATFTASEAPRQDPVVKAGGITFTKGAASSGLDYVYTYAMTGNEEQNGLTVSVDLTDAAGNVATGLKVGDLTPDFKSPEVVTAQVAGNGFAKKGDKVTVAFTASETLGADPAVAAGTMAFAKAAARSGGNGYVYSYTLAGGEAEGRAEIAITLVDEAGNDSGPQVKGTYVVDFTPPAIGAGPVVNVTVARTGTLVEVNVEASEDLSTPATATLGSNDLGTPVQAGRSYQFKYLVKGTEADGTHAVTVGAIADLAGNTAGPFTGPSVTFDFLTPAVTLAGLDKGPHRSPAAAEPTDVVAHVTFTTSEPLDPQASQVAVTIGDRWAAACPPVAATAFDCAFTVPRDLKADDDLEGIKVVAVTVLDGSGNTATTNLGTMTFDFTPPVVAMTVSPARPAVKLGEVLTVAVSASEPLDAAGAALDSGGLAMGAPSVSGTNYTWSYTVKSTDDATYALTATAKDAAGNAAAAPATATVRLDGVVPAITDAKLWPTRVQGGGTFTLSFKASEPLAKDPAASFSNGQDPESAMAAITAEAGYDYTFEGTAPAAGALPYYTVTVVVTDVAGNQGTYSPATVEIDNVPPLLAGLEVAPAGAKLNDTIRAVLSADETLAGPPAITAHSGADVITFTPVDTTPGKVSYTYSYVVVPATAQGIYTVDPFTLSDEGGNARTVTPAPPAVFSVDSTLPVVGNVKPDRTKYSLVAGFNAVTVTLDCSEDVGTGLTVTIGGRAMTCAAYQAAAPNYTCAYTVQAADGEGVKDVNVQASDAAGNPGFGSASVVYDFTNPAVMSAGPSAASYKLGGGIIYTVNVSEPLAGSPGRPTLHVFKDGVEQPGFFGAPAQETDTGFTWSRSAAAVDHGAYTIAIDLVDKVGNAAAGAAGTGFTVDTAAPAITPVGVTSGNAAPTLAKNGDTVTAVFDVNEALAANPPVTLGGQAMAFGAKSGAGPYRYTYTRAAATADGDGVKVATVTATDVAGNVTVLDIGSVTYDFTAPSVVSSVASPNPAKLASQVSYQVTVNETLGNTPGLATSPARAWAGPTASGKTYTWTYTVAAGDPVGWTATLDQVCDVAGNCATNVSANMVPFTVDAVPPSVTAHNVSPGRVKAAQAVTVTLTASEALASDPVVKLGTLAMSKSAQTGNDYTFTYTTTGAEGDGTRTVSVQLTDVAGNQGSAVFAETVEFDYTAPSVASSVASPNPAKLASQLSYQVTVSEALSNTPSLVTAPVLAWTGPVVAGQTYTWTHTVAGADSGAYTAMLSQLCDTLNNCANNVSAGMGGFTVDAVVPFLTVGPALNKSPAFYRSGETVTVTFTTNEDLDASLPVVKLNASTPKAMPCTPGAGNTYSCSVALAGTEAPQGPTEIAIELKDDAGNAGFASTSATIDFTAPGVASAAPSDPNYKAGETIIYAINTSEPLAGSPGRPVVRVYKGAVEQIGFFGNPVLETSTSFTYNNAAAGGMDGTYTVQIDLTDRAGNVTVNAAGVPFVVDTLAPAIGFTAPAVTTNNPGSNLLAKNGEVVTAVFTSSEALAADPVVTLGGRVMAFGSRSGSGPYTYTYTLAAATVDGDGVKVATVTAADPSGNVTVQDIGSVTYDFTKPIVTGSGASPNPAGLGKTLVYTINASEALLGSPGRPVLHVFKGAVEQAGFFGLPASETATSFTYNKPIISGMDGVYTVTADLTDRTGNANAALPAGGFTVDATPPAMATGPTPNKSPANYKVGDTVSMTFTTSEDLDATLPTVTLNTTTPQALPCVAGAGVNDYTCTMGRALLVTDVPQAQVSISISLKDAAQNTGFGSVNVVLDYTNPAIISATPSQALYKAGDTISYTVNVSEALAGSPGRPTLHVFKGGIEQVGFFGAPASETSTSFTYTKVVAGGTDGIYTVTIDLADIAGNAVLAAAGTGWRTDTVAPSIASGPTPNKSPANYKVGDTVAVTFTTSEDLDATLPTVTLNATTPQALPCVAGAGVNDYTCTMGRALLATDLPQAQVGVSISLKDAAQNTGFGSTTVVLDYTNPSVISATPSQAWYKTGDTISYTVNVSEALTGSPGRPTLHAFKGGIEQAGFFGVPASETTTSFTYTKVVAGGTDGVYTVTIDLTDKAGNAILAAAGTGWRTDTVAPSITSGPTPNKSPANYKVGDTVAVTFTTNEDLDAALPTVTLNSTTPQAMPCVAGAGVNDYTCTMGRALLVTDLPQAQVSVSISLKDAAQNTGFGSTTVVLDYTNPAVVSASPSQSIYRSGETIVYTINVSEPLSGSPGRPTVRVLKGGVLQGGYFGAPITETTTSFTYTKAVVAATDGVYTVEIDLTDKAGNAVTNQAGVGWTIDTIAPSVTMLSPAAGKQFSRVGGYNTLTATFDTENLDAVPGGLAVTCGGRALACGAYNAAGSPRYTCSRTVDGADTEGAKSVLVDVRDAAGNDGSGSVGILFDFTGPGVIANTVVVQLVPSAQNPLRNVTTATYSTLVRLSFGLDEAAAANPTVGTYTPQSYGFGYTSGSGTSFVYGYTLVGGTGYSQGAFSVRVTATDAVGNPKSSDLTLPAQQFTIDTVAPAAPDVGTLNRIVYARAPYGALATADGSGVPQPRFTIRGAAGAATASLNVIAYDGKDITTASELGRTVADGTGAFGAALGAGGEFRLAQSDHTVVYLTVVDDAGNTSDDDTATVAVDATPVRDVEWYATLAGKVAGRTLENPHVFQSRQYFSPWLSRDGEPGVTEVGADAHIADRTGGAPQTASISGNLHWYDKTFNELPSSREQFAMAYDTARGRMVMFGGYYNGGWEMNETWEWDGATWRLITTAGPIGRRYPSMAYDAVRGEVILFGGSNGATCEEGAGDYCNYTWAWNGVQWRQVATTGPEGRDRAMMAFDAARGKVVLYGGLSASGNCDGSATNYCRGTWEWDGGRWTQVSTAGPAARALGSMTFDPLRGVSVLHGGYVASGNCDAGTDNGIYCEGTWTWNGAAWAQLATTGTPVGRYGNAMTFDPIRGRPVMMGGYHGTDCGEGSTKDCRYTWELTSGNVWQTINAAGPQGRAKLGIIYDPSIEKVLMFGGRVQTATGNCSEGGAYQWDCTYTWLLDRNGSTWRVAQNGPAARSGSALAFDDYNNYALLAGGISSPDCTEGATPGEYCLYTWSWDGTGWSQRATTGLTGRHHPAMAFYDDGTGNRNRVVLFGGLNDAGDCGEGSGMYCGTTHLWYSQGTPPYWYVPGLSGAAPNPRSHAGMASYNTVAGGTPNQTVMFGGYNDAPSCQEACTIGTCQVWEYDYRCGHTWALTWTGAAYTWTNKKAWVNGAFPEQRFGQTMIWQETATPYVFMFGGDLAGATLNDMGRWNNTAWTELAPATVPGARSDHAMVWDSSRARGLMFGGTNSDMNCDGNGSASCRDIWEWSGAAWTRRVVDGGPGRNFDPAMAYDKQRGRTVLFGEYSTESCGKGGTFPCAKTWELEGGRTEKPAQRMEVTFASSGEDLGSTTLTQVSSSVYAGATGRNTATCSTNASGAYMYVWDKGGWRQVTSNAAAPAAPTELAWSTATDAEFSALSTPVLADRARRLFFDRGLLALNVAVAPTEGNGCTTTFGSVATDYGQSQVNYRRCPEKELRSVVAASIATGTTTGAGNYYTPSPSCAAVSSAPERLFGWTAPSTGTFSFNTTGSAFDTVLDVFDGDCAGPVLGCDDDAGGGGTSKVTLNLTAGQHVVIAVDGYNTNSGSFVLNVTSP